MVDAALATLSTVVRIRRAQYETARAELLFAELEFTRVCGEEEQVRSDRDLAEEAWQVLLTSRAPDPGIVGLAGSWLVARERELGAARLDSQIAQGQRDMAQSSLEVAHARLDASAEVRSQRAREVARRREETGLTETADTFLQRYKP